METLLHCPFCGSPGHASEDDGTGVAYCSSLDCPAHEMLGCSIEQWNTRASADAAHRAREEAVRELLNRIIVTGVDADLRATFQRTALELIVKDARAALTALTHPAHSDAGAGSGEERK